MRRKWGTNIKGFFLLFYPINNPKKQNFEKMKKVSGDVIILHVCTKNHDHVVYASWDIECGNIIFCNFGPFFTLFLTIDSENYNLEIM